MDDNFIPMSESFIGYMYEVYINMLYRKQNPFICNSIRHQQYFQIKTVIYHN
jgi:hypothetical protein